VNYAVNDGVARITLDRADVRNAQDKAMLYELNDAFDLAAQDDEVKVVVLAANGPHFSSGHDLADRSEMDEFSPVTTGADSRSPVLRGAKRLRRKFIWDCVGAGAICRNRLSRRCRVRLLLVV
jgi:enoyl-CoA hydratase/carnithine racemase